MSSRYSGFRFPRSGYRSFYASKPHRRYRTRRMGVSKLRTRSTNQFGGYSKAVVPRRSYNVKEEKYYDDNASIAGAIGQYPAGWSAFYLPAMVRGTGPVQRIGDQIFAKWLYMSFLVNHNSGGAVNQRVKWMVVLHKSPYNAAPVAAEVFQTTTTMDGGRSLDYLDQYKVLAEGQVLLELQIHSCELVRKNIKLGFPIKFTGNGGTVADVSMNNIELLIWSDQAANQPTLSEGTWRVTFVDS